MTLIQSIPSLLQLLAITGGVLLILGLTRRFNYFGLRAKIVIAILMTGTISLGFLSFFAIRNTNQITNSLSGRLETSVRLLAEEQLINTVVTESNLANQSFEEIMEEVVSLSRYWSNTESQKNILAQGTYWDATKDLVRLTGGQYGNSPDDPSSVFVPVNVDIDEGLKTSLNTSAYLDFYAPEILSRNPAILAIYGIAQDGVTRYYPNINLATLLPPDFNPTERPYYEITTPLFNPQRLARWAIPYIDAAGGGLVVTVAAPVYFGDTFAGVVASDMRLAIITKQIEDIRIGQTGYAFLLDDAGRIISMPQAGYELFGINPATINPDEYYKQTVLGLGTDELGTTTRRMVAGGTGLLVAEINGADTYIAFAPIKANGYSVGVVVPVLELQGAIFNARNETQRQLTSATQTALLIVLILFLAAIAVSLSLGGIIASPIVQLTQTANRIVGGDLSAQASITSRDEIGTLAMSFNSMTNRLQETLADLEQRVEKRTSELLTANQKNEQRALRFEAVSKVARTISTTKDLDTLLPQISSSISTQFGFYHVGIFLMDIRKEYAVLSAANSDGGKKMLEYNHKLKVGETGIVGFVTDTGKPRVALDTGADVVFFNNPLLPETRSEIALPIISGDEILGALDVQSKAQNAFDQEDINILSILADQVSIAIQNAKQYEESQRALAESESLSRQFIQAGWQEFTQNRKLVGIRHSGMRATRLYGNNGKGGNTDQVPSDQTQQKPKGATLSIPLKLRDEMIGSVDVRTMDNRPWDQDELDIVNAIVEHAALALENARLFEETNHRAERERLVSDITSKIRSVSDPQAMIQTALEELRNALGASRVQIIPQQVDETD